MKAILCPRYGPPDVLVLRDIPIPKPGPGEVLVRVRAASLNAADWHIIMASPALVRLMMGFARPDPAKYKGPGGDMAGLVEGNGPGASKFKAGDEVIADLYNSKFGGCAEYVCVLEKDLVAKPGNLSFEEAATLPLAGGTALKAVRDMGKVAPGVKVLINGASGGVGIFALQLAKALGGQVTAVCSAEKAGQARELGADRVIDYRKEDFTQSGLRYDVIVGVNGYQPIRRYRASLEPGGRYIMVGGTGRQMAEAGFMGPFLSNEGKTLKLLNTKPEAERVEFLARMAGEGRLRTVIDQVYPLQETAKAMGKLVEGHAMGKIVIKVS